MFLIYLIFWLVLGGIFRVTAKKHWILLYVIPSLWFFILILADLNFLGFPQVNINTQFLILGFIITLSMSILLTFLFLITFVKSRNLLQNSITVSTASVGLLKFLFLFLLVNYSLFGSRALQYVLANGFDSNYRKFAMGFGVDSVIFSSPVEYFYFNALVHATLFIYMCMAVSRFVISNNASWLYGLFLFMLLDSLITMGRYYIYIFFVVVLLSYYLSGSLNIRRVFIYFLSTILFLYLLSSLRYSDGMDISVFFNKYFVAYHTYGVYLLDNYLENVYKPSMDYWYGGAFFSSYQYFLTKFFQVFGLEISSFLNSKEFLAQAEFIYLGYYKGELYSANAYYTVIADMIRDFGYFGVIIFSALSGSVYSFIYFKFQQTNSLKYLSLFILSFIFLYFSILKNQFGQQYLVLAILFFILFPSQFYSRKVSS